MYASSCSICSAASRPRPRRLLADPASVIPMVGASGAIGGVMGAYIVLYPRVHVHMLVVLGFYVTTFAVPAVFMLGYWFLHAGPERRDLDRRRGRRRRVLGARRRLRRRRRARLVVPQSSPARTAPVPWLAAGSVADSQLAQGQTLAAPAPLVVASADCGGSCRQAAALSARSVPSEGATADCRSRARGVVEVSAPQWPARRSAVR